MRPTQIAALAALAIAGAAYYSAVSLLLHHSFHSNGWDLGIFEQVLWNTSEGRWFEYSFRQMRYLGDHWQPALVLFVPLDWLFDGADPLLVAQGVGIGLAVVPLWDATRRLVDERWAWCTSVAYLLSLGVARAANYDFHPEAFMPLLLFSGLWTLAAGRRREFAWVCVALLVMKEDGVLSVLALSWIAYLSFGWKRIARLTAASGIAYAVVVSVAVMPFFLGGNKNPLNERYGYLLPQNALTSPWSAVSGVFEHLISLSAFGAVLLVLTAAAFLPLLRPRLLPALAVVTLPPLLSDQFSQSRLDLHYLAVPMSMALVVAIVSARDLPSILERFAPADVPRATRWVPVALPVIAVILFAWKSPLPPSFAADTTRFDVDEHSRIASRFLERIPPKARVSAQATLVPHLAERQRILEFPRVSDAEYVVLDEKRAVPGYDLPGFEECASALPQMGFTIVAEEDGLSLWRRTNLVYERMERCHFVRDRAPGWWRSPPGW